MREARAVARGFLEAGDDALGAPCLTPVPTSATLQAMERKPVARTRAAERSLVPLLLGLAALATLILLVVIIVPR